MCKGAICDSYTILNTQLADRSIYFTFHNFFFFIFYYKQRYISITRPIFTIFFTEWKVFA